MLLRLAYLGVTNAFAMLRLLPMSDRDKDAEILALRHQITVLERQLGNGEGAVRPERSGVPGGAAAPAAAGRAARGAAAGTPGHGAALAPRSASPAATRPRPGPSARAGRGPCAPSASWCCAWRGRTPAGATAASTANCSSSGVKVAASTVWEILKEAGIDPAPERASSTWADFLRSQADALLACDFLETVTLTGARMYVFAVIEHASRRIRILGATAHPTAVLGGAGREEPRHGPRGRRLPGRFLIRDRDGKFPELFDAVLADAGIEVVLSGVRMPRMNSIMERWVQTCRRELLDRTLIWNQRHLLHALREFEQFYNEHRPPRPPLPWRFRRRPGAVRGEDGWAEERPASGCWAGRWSSW